ncbi:MAG: hypothetical protein KAS53_10260 [Candidatus Cloacimonetes bacterium]|nr:hypothetical protein [Candidatus Cloacimonadota bacterium]
MKKSMIVIMMMVIAFSMNLFGEVVSEKTEDQAGITESKHEEVKKECGPDCTMPCCAEKNAGKNHVCTEKCEIAKNHVCTDECKLDDVNKTCELAVLKNHCSNEVKEEGCKPTGCGQKAEQKGCHKL